LAVETQCQFFQSISFPQIIDAGLRIARLGNSSVRYEVGLFHQGSDEAAAFGYFVHVFVDRTTRRPVSIPEPIRTALARITLS
jgi:acyl-CoA thioester hydrolase